MKVLLINGSPHEKSCTYTALSEVAKALEEEGIETEIFYIGMKPISGCIDCKKCFGKEKPQCVFDDVVNVVAEKLSQADGLIVGSPVYTASPNGTLIALLDRLFRIFRQSAQEGGLAFKPAAAVVSARRAGTTASLDVLNKYFLSSCMPVVASQQYWNIVHGYTPDDVRQDEEGVQTMRTLGKNMAWLLKCIHQGAENGIQHPVAEERKRTNFIR